MTRQIDKGIPLELALIVFCCSACSLTTSPAARAESMTRVQGEVTYLEKSGKNLYVELRVGPKTVGVELLPKVARAHGARIKKGMLLEVRGKRGAGDKSIAYTLEVGEVAALRLPTSSATLARALAPLVMRKGPLPNAEVEMIAGFGAWPSTSKDEVGRKLAQAAQDAVGRAVIDSGLTELWRAYQRPAPFLAMIRGARAALRRHRLRGAFYLPAFELRREGGRKKAGRLLDWTRGWAQHTLAGKPFVKTRFGKEEFWNKAGDEVLWACPNSPEWRRRFLSSVRAAAKEGVQTFFVDVPYLHRQGELTTCACTHCRKRFKRESGLPLPKRAAPSEIGYRRWLWWRHSVVSGFFAAVRQAARSVNPRAKLVVEEYPAYLEGATTATGLDIGLLGREVDIFAHEYSAKQFDKKPYSKADRLALATTLSLYRGLDAWRPTWVLSYAHKPADSRVNAAFHLAYDASFWETRAPEMNDTTVGRPWRRRLFGWFAKHRAAFGHSRQLASVALLYSPRARDFSPAHFSSLMRVSRRLAASRVPYRVLSTRDRQRLKDYTTVVLADVTAMTKETAAALASSGARVLIVGGPPQKGPWGLRAQKAAFNYERVSLLDLPQKVGKLPVIVEGPDLVLNVLQRKGEVQVRLANLGSKARSAKVRVRLAGTTSVTELPFLGMPRRARISRKHGELQVSVRVVDMTILRFMMR